MHAHIEKAKKIQLTSFLQLCGNEPTIFKVPSKAFFTGVEMVSLTYYFNELLVAFTTNVRRLSQLYKTKHTTISKLI